MKIFNTKSPLELKVQEVEKLMLKLGISISYTYNGLAVNYEGKQYPIVCLENRDTMVDFPRQFESERIKFSDD